MTQSKIVQRHRRIQYAFILFCGAVLSGGGLLLKNGLSTIDIAVRETLVLTQVS